jgi:predicted N-formylglutamate amidohydrolase
MLQRNPAVIGAVDGGESHEIVGGRVAAGVILLCDHARNTIPPEYADLGLPPSELARHIAYDIGAEGVTRAMAEALGCPAVLSRFSRLLIDPNRGDDDPTRVMRLSDGAIVPGNARSDAAEVAARARRFAAPYHAAVAGVIDASLAAGMVPAIVSIHSFTPVMKGIARPWHVGILWDTDPRLPRPLLSALGAEPDLVVGDNEPYSGALAGDTISRHATARGLANALIEVRQDLIAHEADAARWGRRLAAILSPLLVDPALRDMKAYGSRVA